MAATAGGASGQTAVHSTPPKSPAPLSPAAGAAAQSTTTAPSASTAAEAGTGTSQTPGYTVTLPTGRYLVWIEQGQARGIPVLVDSTASAAAQIPAAGAGPATLYVLDPTGYRLDVVPNAGTKTVVKAADLNRYPGISVAVNDKTGKPMDYALVRAVGSDGVEHSQVLTPANGGRVELTNIPAGTVTVTASRGAADEATVKTDLPPAAGGAEPTVTVAMSSAAVLPVAAPAAAADHPARRPRRSAAQEALPPAPGISAAEVLIPLVMLGILAGLLYWWYSHQEQAREVANLGLQKLGLSPLEPITAAPDPATARPARPGTSAAADPSVCPFCGTRKDPATGSCACTLVPAGVGTATPAVSGGSLSTGPRLITLDGPARGQIFPIGAEATVGRDAGHTISLAGDTAVSRRHARFTNNGGQVEVVDEASSNGTFVNGARITQQPLQPSDEIQIGHSRFRYEVS